MAQLGLAAQTARTYAQFARSEEHTSELQSQLNLVCRLLLEKKKKHTHFITSPLPTPISNVARLINHISYLNSHLTPTSDLIPSSSLEPISLYYNSSRQKQFT